MADHAEMLDTGDLITRCDKPGNVGEPITLQQLTDRHTERHRCLESALGGWNDVMMLLLLLLYFTNRRCRETNRDSACQLSSLHGIGVAESYYEYMQSDLQ